MDEIADSIDAQKHMRWDGRSNSHYEVWYTTLNQLNSGAGFWLRYALLCSRNGERTAQVWFTSSVPGVADANVAMAQKYPIDQFSSATQPFSVHMGPCILGSARMTGMLDAGGTPVTWDLVYEPVTDPLQYLPDVFYKTRWIHSKVLAPHPFMVIGGKIQIRDHQFIFNGDPGEQGHVWGSRHADEWVWFHCSSFVEEGGDPVEGYVTGITAQQRLVASLLLPPLSFGHLVWKEQHIQVRPATRWDERWRRLCEWKGKTGDQEVTVSVTIPWTEMVLAEYEDPAGHAVYCHHTDRADCLIHFRAPRRPPALFRSKGMAHLEIGSRSVDVRATRRVTIQS